MLNQRQNIFKSVNRKRLNTDEKVDPGSPLSSIMKSAAQRRRGKYDFTGSEPEDRIVSYDSDSIFATGMENEKTTMMDGGVQEQFAQRQGWGSKASAGIARAFVKAGFEVAKMPGVVAGAYGAAFAEDGEGWDTFVNNSWVQKMTELNETVNKELLPVYVKKSVEDGKLFDNLSSVDFWATEGADGAGFILSMFAPGAAIKSLNLGSKFTKFASMSEKVSNAQKILGITPSTIDNVAITAANTIFEASAEAGNAMDTFEKDLTQKFNSGQIDRAQYDELMQQKGLLGRDIFLTNVAILAGPNAINTKLLYGKGASKLMNIKDKSGAIVDKVGLSALNRVGRVGGSFINALGREGFYEEGLQMTAENYFKDKASEGELTDNYLGNIDINNFQTEYLNMLTTTEGQKAIALGGLLGGGMQSVQGFKQDSRNIKETNRLLDVGKEVSDMFLATTINPDIYKRSDEVDPETNEYAFELDKNGKKIIDPVKRDAVIEKAYNAETFSKIFDLAQEVGDTEALSYLQQHAENNLIMPFLSNDELGIDMLKEFLNENKEITQDRKDAILQKAEKVQSSYSEFTNFGKDILNLKNNSASKSDILDFHNMLREVYTYKTAQELDLTSQLESTNEQIDKFLSDRNITEEQLLDKVDKAAAKINNDIRYEKLKKQKENLTKQLEKVKDEKDLVWNKEAQQKAFDERIEDINKKREKESAENIKNVEEVLSNVENAETVNEVNEAIEGKEEPLDIDAELADLENKIASAKNPSQTKPETKSETKPIETVDEETAEVIKQRAENKKAEIVNKQDVEINVQNNKVSQEAVEEVNEKIEAIRTLQDFDLNGVKFDFAEFFGTYFITTSDNSVNKEFDSLDAMVNYAIDNILKVKKPDTNVNTKKEFETTEEIIVHQKEAEETIGKIDDDLSRDEEHPSIKTLGVYKDGNKPDYIPEAFYNWLLRFKDKSGTKVRFSIPKYVTGSSLKALDMFNKGDFSNKDLLIKYLPIQIDINEFTYAFIPTINIDLSETHPEYVSRKNLVDALIDNKSYDGLYTTVQYQKGGQINYAKPERTTDVNGNENIQLIENNVSEFEQFESNPSKVPLFFVMDELGMVHNENNQISLEFNSSLTDQQKGYIYTQLESYNGSVAPIKLNVRKLSNEQAELIYKIYKTIFDYNQNNEFKVNQKTATLDILYKQNPLLKTEIEKTLAKELNIFKNKNNIIVGDLMNLLIHDNLALDGSTKAYTTQFRGASISFGEDSYVNFAKEVPEYKQALLDFLTQQKRQNIKLKFLAGENLNIDKVKYKEYLINEKVLNVNIDVNKPFTGDINVYLSSKAITKESKSSNNSQSIEAKKADIERRRENELKKASDKVNDSNYSYDDVDAYQDAMTDVMAEQNEINIKYDAELAGLENNNKTLENKQENTLNSENNPLSLKPIKKPGLKFNLANNKPKPGGLQNNPDKKC